MSIGLLSHRLKVKVRQMDLDSSSFNALMFAALEAGRLDADRLTSASAKELRLASCRSPKLLLPNSKHFGIGRAIRAAYCFGIASSIPSRSEKSLPSETVQLWARLQRLLTQAFLTMPKAGRTAIVNSFDHLPAGRLWKTNCFGAAAVAKVAYVASARGYEVRYPRTIIDTAHAVDLFCSMDGFHLAIQVKSTRQGFSYRILHERPAGAADLKLWCGVLPLAKRSKIGKMIPVMAYVGIKSWSQLKDSATSSGFQSITERLTSRR